jgi:hypothetical protein
MGQRWRREKGSHRRFRISNFRFDPRFAIEIVSPMLPCPEIDTHTSVKVDYAGTKSRCRIPAFGAKAALSAPNSVIDEVPEKLRTLLSLTKVFRRLSARIVFQRNPL